MKLKSGMKKKINGHRKRKYQLFNGKELQLAIGLAFRSKGQRNVLGGK